MWSSTGGAPVPALAAPEEDIQEEDHEEAPAAGQVDPPPAGAAPGAAAPAAVRAIFNCSCSHALSGVSQSLAHMWASQSQAELGKNLMNRIIEETKDIAKIESQPKFEGRQMVMIIQPI